MTMQNEHIRITVLRSFVRSIARFCSFLRQLLGR